MARAEINIRHFKLVSGEEIIALLTEKNDNTIIIERPFKRVTNMLGGVHFTPWFPFSDQKLYAVSRKTIVHDTRLDETVAQEYIKIATDDTPSIKKVRMKTKDSLLDEMEDFIEDDFEIEFKDENKTIH